MVYPDSSQTTGPGGANRRHPEAGTTEEEQTRPRFLTAVSLLLAVIAVLMVAQSATAAVLTRAPSASFGPDGTASTSFGLATGMAFDWANGRVYVADRKPGVEKVYAFAMPGHTPLGGAFPLSAADDSRVMLAVDNSASPSAGNIYVLSLFSRVLKGFDSNGTPLGGFPITVASLPSFPFSVAVDSDGIVYVDVASEGSPQEIRKYDDEGNFLGAVDTSSLGSPGWGLAFASNDDLFFSLVPLGTGLNLPPSEREERLRAVYKATAASGYSLGSVTRIPWEAEHPGAVAAPGAITVDSSTNTLYVADENRISAQDAASGSLKYQFGGGIHQPVLGVGFEALAADEATDTVYALDRILDQSKVYAFGPPQLFGDASATTTAATNVTDTSAQIGGIVDDKNDLPTKWRLELSADQGGSWNTVSSGQTPGGESAFPVSGAVTGLIPNTSYRFRVVVVKAAGGGFAEVQSLPRSFHTLAVPPVVTDLGVVQVADTSARLAATIDPRNAPTGYVFEYGTTPALGLGTTPVGIGGGTKPVTVSQLVSGLAKDTTYYFRAVATNTIGSATSGSATFHTRSIPFPDADPGNCANEAIRQEQNATYLPDCRAYEMVSPPDKNQGSAIGSTLAFAKVGFSKDGEGVVYCTNALFGEPPTQQGQNCGQYLARRESGGWTSKNPFPHYCPWGIEGHQEGFRVHLSGESYDRAAIEVPELTTPCDPLDPAAPSPSVNLYREDLTTNPFEFDLLAPRNGGFTILEEGLTAGYFAGGTADLSHVVYASLYNQTPDAPTPEERYLKLYDWEEEGHGDCVEAGGCLDLVSVAPDGQPFTTNSKLPGLGGQGSGAWPDPSAVSADGKRVYFVNPTEGIYLPASHCGDPGCELYMREDGESTFQVSASECTASCGIASSLNRFRWASPAGDIAIFSSCGKLTDASSAAVSGCTNTLESSSEGKQKLYRWDRNGAPGHRLLDISIDEEPADETQPHAKDIIGASEDGEVIYFVAGGQLVSGAPTGPISGTAFKLYRWLYNDGAPSLEYLGPYQGTRASGSPTVEFDFDPNLDRYHDRVTADGRYLTILTPLRLVTGDSDSDNDMYRWSEEDGWLCVSCQLPEVPSAGHASSVDPHVSYNQVESELESQGTEYTISDDGQRIFFSTPDALVPEDVNGEASCDILNSRNEGTLYACADVYEWHDGTVSLLTSGTGSKPFILIGATHTGRDVFVATGERLLGWDIDNGTDIYDIRTGGGFPEPAAQPPSCEAEGCRGAGTSAPAVAGAGTGVFEGPGNPAVKRPGTTCPKGRHKVRRKGKVHCVTTSHNRRRAANDNRRAGR